MTTHEKTTRISLIGVIVLGVATLVLMAWHIVRL
jgi:hypothetical protein